MQILSILYVQILSVHYMQNLSILCVQTLMISVLYVQILSILYVQILSILYVQIVRKFSAFQASTRRESAILIGQGILFFISIYLRVICRINLFHVSCVFSYTGQ